MTVFAPTTVSNASVQATAYYAAANPIGTHRCIATGKAWTGGKAADAVCGMTVDPAAAAAHADYDGDTYYFCSSGCRDRFTADAASFAAKHSHR